MTVVLKRLKDNTQWQLSLSLPDVSKGQKPLYTTFPRSLFLARKLTWSYIYTAAKQIKKPITVLFETTKVNKLFLVQSP